MKDIIKASSNLTFRRPKLVSRRVIHTVRPNPRKCWHIPFTEIAKNTKKRWQARFFSTGTAPLVPSSSQLMRPQQRSSQDSRHLADGEAKSQSNVPAGGRLFPFGKRIKLTSPRARHALHTPPRLTKTKRLKAKGYEGGVGVGVTAGWPSSRRTPAAPLSPKDLRAGV